MDCDKIIEQLSAYIDDALLPDEKESVERHLRTCTQCATSLAELKKTVHRLRGLEEITPPSWLTQKIMTRVKTESKEKKPRLIERLFFPLWIKLPVETVGIVLIAITALYVFKSMEPDLKPVIPQQEAPLMQSPTKNKEMSRQQAREKTPQPPPSGKSKEEKTAQEISSAAQDKPLSAPAPQRPLQGKEEASRENRSEMPRTKTTGTLEEGLPAAAGLTAHDQGSQETSRRAAGKAPAPPEKTDIGLSFKTHDLDVARKEIKETLLDLGGRVVKDESYPEVLVIVGDLGSEKLSPFIAKLKMLGYLRDRIPTPISDKERVLIKMTVSKQSETLPEKNR